MKRSTSGDDVATDFHAATTAPSPAMKGAPQGGVSPELKDNASHKTRLAKLPVDFTSIIVAAVLFALLLGWYAWLELSERRRRQRDARRKASADAEDTKKDAES